MTDAVSEFVRRRQPESLEEIEDTIVQHRRATDQSTRALEQTPARDPLTDIALLVAALPLRVAMEMADAVVTLPDYKPPTSKIELAMLLNDWAEKRLAAVYGPPDSQKPVHG